MKNLAIVGFGRFGQLLYRFFHKQLPVGVVDPYQAVKRKYRKVPFISPAELTEYEYIILATPVSAIETVAEEIRDHLAPSTVVMDVGAVKTYPLSVLQRELPGEVHIVGSHPLFGPDSASHGFNGHIIILTPTRVEKSAFQRVKRFWEQQGVEVVEFTAHEQDRLMAWTLALTHFLGRALVQLPLPETPIATRDYKFLKNLIRKINRDTPELFLDMHRFNPYTAEMRKALAEAIESLKSHLDHLQKEID